MRFRRVGFLSVVLLAGSLASPLVPSAGAATSNVHNSAVVSAFGDTTSTLHNATWRFDDSTRFFDVTELAGHETHVLLEQGVQTVDIYLSPAQGKTAVTPGHYDNDSATAPDLGLSMNVGSQSCSDRAVAEVTDVGRDAGGVLNRFAMTFSTTCGTLDTIVGEVRWHEPNPDPVLAVAPTRLDYGHQDVGFDRPAPVHVTNATGAPLTVTSARTTGPFTVGSSNCGVLAPGGGCDVTVRFRPTVGGLANGTLTLTDSNGAVHSVPLTGLGRTGTGVALRSTSGDPVGLGKSLSFTHANGSDLSYGQVSSSTRVRAFGPGAPAAGEYWDGSLTAPSGKQFVAGSYLPAQRDGFQKPGFAGVEFDGDSRGCNSSTGSIYVRRYDVSPSGRVIASDVLFRQRCDGSPGDLYGEVTYSAPPPIGAVEVRYAQLGAPLLGLPTGPEHDAFGGRGVTYELGSITTSAATGTHEVHGAIAREWSPAIAGVIGLPTTDERSTPDTRGRYNQFARGCVYWTPATGAHEVHGTIKTRWASLGWERSRLGYPTSDEYAVPGGRASRFQHGVITWKAATGATTITYS